MAESGKAMPLPEAMPLSSPFRPGPGDAEAPPLVGFAELRDRLAQKHPEFRSALSAERDAEQFCSEVRAQLKEKRLSLEINQEAMAKRLNLSQSAISKLESGRGDIGLKTIHRYARALDLRPVLTCLATAEEPTLATPTGVLDPATKPDLGSTIAAMLTAFDIQADAQKLLTAALDKQAEAQKIFMRQVGNALGHEIGAATQTAEEKEPA
jgi:transcriptional regulator with XRE-family HTH domain